MQFLFDAAYPNGTTTTLPHTQRIALAEHLMEKFFVPHSLRVANPAWPALALGLMWNFPTEPTRTSRLPYLA
jgi:hypothetical protein